MRINDVGEAIAKLVEPWPDVPGPVTSAEGVRDVTAVSGVVVDLNMARPNEWEANRLYVWPLLHQHPLAGAGNPPEEREDFTFQLVYVADRASEEARIQARRSVSDALDEKGHSYAAAIAANRSRYAAGTPAPWGHLATAIDHNTTVTFGVRGIGVLVAGNRFVQYT